MIAFKVEDRKQFTSKLFVGETFDRFLVREAEIVTYNTFNIDGHIRQGYYSEEELEEKRLEELSSWAMIKPVCFSLIKGKKLPLSFRIVLQLSPAGIGSFLKKTGIAMTAEQVNGLYLNIKFDEEGLTCVTGTSVNFFTLDKSLDREWDSMIEKFFSQNEIAVEI